MRRPPGSCCPCFFAALAPAATARADDPTRPHVRGPTRRDRCLCQGKVKTFDRVPLDASLALPAGSSLPLVVLSHCYGGAKLGYQDMEPLRLRATPCSPSARGFGESCGNPLRAWPTEGVERDLRGRRALARAAPARCVSGAAHGCAGRSRRFRVADPAFGWD